MEKHPLIGILVTKRNSRKRILELYHRYHNLNLKLIAFTPADIIWKEQRIIGLGLKKGRWTQSSFSFPYVVYNQSFNKQTETVQRLERVLGRNKCFNNINFFNKWDLYNVLKQSKLKSCVPDTFLYNEVKVSELLKKFKLLYIKPYYGCKGKSVYRVELTDHGDIHISLHSLAPRIICRKYDNLQEKLDVLLGQKQKYIVQQGIRMSQLDQQYFDIRVLVQKDILGEWTVSSLACRVAHKDYFNTSISEAVYDAAEFLPRFFAPIEMNEILLTLQELSINAAHEAETHIGSLGELSVDFVLDEHSKLRIIELNGKPQKNIYKDLKSIKHTKLIYSRPMEYAYYLSQN